MISTTSRIKGIVARAQAGDISAVEEIYRLFFDKIYAYVLLSIRDRHAAEDLTQEIFERVFKKLGRYREDPQKPFEAWLFRVARNMVIDEHKKLRRRGIELFEWSDSVQPGSSPDELEQVLYWIQDSDLAMFVERLPAKQRDVISLHYLFGWRFKDIAAMLGTTTGAVSQLHRRALDTLDVRMRAVGRRADRQRRSPMLVRLRPRRVMVSRRFALGGTTGSGAPGARN